jgi:hypothetical protein
MGVAVRKISWRARILSAIGISGVLLAGGVVASPPANAVDGFYDCGSNWFEAYGYMTVFSGDWGYWQGYAKLGDRTQWGAYSKSSTSARLDGGINYVHDGKVYNNSRVFCD